jgi:hypothetical protein
MCRCHSHSPCHGCSVAVDRRYFLKRGGAALAAVGCLSPLSRTAAGGESKKVRIAAVFLAQVRNSWPYPGFDAAGRQQEIVAALRQGCPDVEFLPITIQTADEAGQALGLCDQVDGYLVYVSTLSWALGGTLAAIGKLNKPTIVATEFLGGCGMFLTRAPALVRDGGTVAVSTTRLDDLVVAARQFAALGESELTPAEFARRCERAYRSTFPPAEDMPWADDDLKPADMAECVERFRKAKVLVVGRGAGGRQQSLLGATWQHVDWNELKACYPGVDPDEAAEWAARWTRQATVLPPGEYVEPSVPSAQTIADAAKVYLALLQLLKKYDTNLITMNCGGGVTVPGALPTFPCLGFMQILDDGGLGICEAQEDDSASMLMAHVLTGRPGFVSDPALDTSQNRIVYSHCVGPTKVFGPSGEQNGYHIRTSHSRVGAVVESLMPEGHLTTSFRTNLSRKQMIVHQARSLGPLASEHGCRTKLIGEVCGDIGKMFERWDQFGWHRVTVYGDVKEPLAEFGRILGLEVIEEA